MGIVKDIDKGFKRILKNMKEIDNSYVDVGVLSKSGQHKKSKMTVAAIASIQEYGTQIKVTNKMRGFFYHKGFKLSKDIITIPSRPFMRQTFDKNAVKINSRLKQLKSDIFKGKLSVRGALRIVGAWYKAETQQTIRNGNFKANSEMTKILKGSAKPLIASGQLRQSINFEVKIR